VGGRGTLWGAAIGALVVNWLRVSISEARPDDWSYLQGGLFVIVLAVAPGGLIGVGRMLWMRAGRATRRRSAGTSVIAEVAP
jgi:urea transport system permease protein